MADTLEDRIKNYYEHPYRIYMTRNMPFIIRLDGKSFHSYTKKFEKPWSKEIKNAFQYAGKILLKEISGSKFIYSQSDEVSVLITDYDTIKTESWFGKNLQKIVSVSSSILTCEFNKYISDNTDVKKSAYFDARCFTIPKEEIVNAFIWRQNDCKRNSVMCLGQKHFSSKQLHGKNNIRTKEMLNNIGIDWNELEPWKKYGWCMFRDESSIVIDESIPIFSDDRPYIEKYI